jgi:crotonobetainyl-CoA:carnitine CoA-transferase CaiB-like acyl-CoA transferase
VASNYLISGKLPKRYGNAHANIVPYQSFQASDDWFILAVGNDRQFEKLCEVVGDMELAHDIRFTTNASRVENRAALLAILKPVFLKRSAGDWLSAFESSGIPSGPINTLDQVFTEPQTAARQMRIEMEHPTIGKLPLVGSPLKFSETPVGYRFPPPKLGEHTERILREAAKK